MFTATLTIQDLDVPTPEAAANILIAVASGDARPIFIEVTNQHTDQSRMIKVEDPLTIFTDMLAALRRAEYQLAEEVERRGDEDEEYESPMSPVLDEVRAAIAKAEGDHA